ncbi:uncharacterized protein N7487_007359 [Penicillium crustosum]|uniref:uncharacterized protein n=1 Tax=Penicillium crustosum TaxID=36656 RepID=UPI0023A1C4C3|nr:uncharacterized protein N7487_007359 [Penicillium crustosum]KAJ5401463.1 hypothetical protein N7487_007359 [Penicillium crustosum]
MKSAMTRVKAIHHAVMAAKISATGQRGHIRKWTVIPQTLCSGDSQGTVGNEAMDSRGEKEEEEEEEEEIAAGPIVFHLLVSRLFIHELGIGSGKKITKSTPTAMLASEIPLMLPNGTARLQSFTHCLGWF